MVSNIPPNYEYIQEVTKSNIAHILEVKKYNPYHDRLGRFTSSGGGVGGASLGMGVGNYVVEGKRAAVSGTLQAAEAKNKDLDHEVATVVDPHTGKAVFSKDGDATGVHFNSSELWEIKGRIVTHNHPDEVIFSPADVAVSYHVKAIRATNPSGKVYELAEMNNRQAVQDYNKHYMEVRAKSLKRLGVAENSRDKDLTPEQRKSSYAEISDSCDKWLADNASKYRYQYRAGRIEE